MNFSKLHRSCPGIARAARLVEADHRAEVAFGAQHTVDFWVVASSDVLVHVGEVTPYSSR